MDAIILTKNDWVECDGCGEKIPPYSGIEHSIKKQKHIQMMKLWNLLLKVESLILL